MAAVAGLTLVSSGAAGAAPEAPDAVSADAAGKIDQALRADLEEGKVDFWVRFADRPDLSGMSAIKDWDARGEAVYDALTSTAAASQLRVLKELEDSGASYSQFWITNAIRVRGGTEQLALTIAGDREVEGLYPTTTYDVPELEPAVPDTVAPAAVEWGVDDINADEVWNTFGVHGEGIVVGSIDTGVEYDHPALVNQYRGNNGDGTFDHDYNWFDATGGDSPVPVDFDAHGSHVTGTMVGDDGGDNKIGVAPGARWISANGCCPSDEALITSGQWMLAPTRVDGSDPDPSMRPHVINNSWGTTQPSNDPFMEDISEAWAAAGQFGVWANGNIGPDCETSGSPGSRIINYSVGNYDSTHTIADTSSRGVGQDGEIKPNISAPGTAVRSSVPGGGYAYFSGTSMASPHVAGAIALLWSGTPALVGDIEATVALLDGTAVDTDDLQCGGTVADNNVFGEGRLDALALYQAAPRGPVGTVVGTITDAATGDPIAGAEVVVQGPLERTLRTGPDGSYRLMASVGDYTVTASKFGWVTGTTPVTVTEDQTVTASLALERSPSGTLSGVVTDGSGQGYPLYAKVAVSGTTLFTYTDPADGSYELVLPLDTPVQLEVQVQYPGYETLTEPAVLTADATRDLQVPVDSAACIANGYQLSMPGLSESFDASELPPGWTSVTDPESGAGWLFDDPAGTGNWTGGEDGFAVADPSSQGADSMDASLVSPSQDLTGAASPVVEFNSAFISNEYGDVDVSVDGGQTWTTVVRFENFHEGIPVSAPLPMAAGEADVRLRFHYHPNEGGWMWQVDDVYLGDRTCDPVGDGGYVFGNVYSGTTENPLRGAKVTSLDNPSDSGISTDTPADEGQDDGFYWLYSELTDTHPFQATARLYGAQTQDVTVPVRGAVRADYTLYGGLLVTDPGQIDTTVELGESATRDLTITNTGQAASEVEIKEVRGDFVMQRADDSRMATSKALELAGAPERNAPGTPSYAAFPGTGKSAGASDAPQAQGPAEEPWEQLTSYPTPIMDNRVVALDGSWYSVGGSDGSSSTLDVYRYDNATMAWTAVAPLPEALNAPAAAAIEGRVVVTGGWTESGDPGNATYVYDPGADAWTTASPAPVAVSAAGQAVVDGELYVVGGCSTGMCDPMQSSVAVYNLAADTWRQVADYPESMAFTSCGGIDGAVYCAGGVSSVAGELTSAYSYDPGTDSWIPVADLPAPLWGSSYSAANGMLILTGGAQNDSMTNAAYAYDPAGDTWSEMPRPNNSLFRGGGACGFVRVGGGAGWTPNDAVELLPGLDDCGDSGVDVPWLSVDRTEFTLEPGASTTVTVTTDGDVPQPGVYSAGLRVTGGVPGSEPLVDVTMTVTPPTTWGKLTGEVTGLACDGAATPLGGASVDATPTRTGSPQWRMVTDPAGLYARWIDTRLGELELIGSASGYFSRTELVTPLRGQITEQDFPLTDVDCEAPAPIHPEVVRIAGANRYETAAAISRAYAPGVDVVFVATGLEYADALAAAARAGSVGAPVLLTKPDSLPSATAHELARLDADRVVVLGGAQAVQQPVLDLIKKVSAAPTTRLGGTDRYDTAARISGLTTASDVVYVASGQDYPDALAGAARAGAVDAPVLLVKKGSLPSTTARELARLSPDRIVLLGGELAVEGQVETALGAYGTVERVAGAERYATAAAVAEDYPTAATVFVASGQNWPDALAGAARAGFEESPLLLTKSDAVPDSTWSALERLEPATVSVLGGSAVIDDTVLDLLRTLE